MVELFSKQVAEQIFNRMKSNKSEENKKYCNGIEFGNLFDNYPDYPTTYPPPKVDINSFEQLRNKIEWYMSNDFNQFLFEINNTSMMDQGKQKEFSNFIKCFKQSISITDDEFKIFKENLNKNKTYSNSHLINESDIIIRQYALEEKKNILVGKLGSTVYPEDFNLCKRILYILDMKYLVYVRRNIDIHCVNLKATSIHPNIYNNYFNNIYLQNPDYNKYNKNFYNLLNDWNNGVYAKERGDLSDNRLPIEIIAYDIKRKFLNIFNDTKDKKDENINLFSFKTGNTSLINYTWYNEVEEVNNVLKTPGIQVNLQNAFGETALIIALKKKYYEIAKNLLNFGAFPLYLKDLRYFEVHETQIFNEKLKERDETPYTITLHYTNSYTTNPRQCENKTALEYIAEIQDKKERESIEKILISKGFTPLPFKPTNHGVE